MIKPARMVRAADEFQKQRAWLALPAAVARKFADDKAVNLAALIAYYAFVAIFPLLLVLVTVLNILLGNDAALREKLLKSALAHYPVIGPQLQSSIAPLQKTGIALIVGLLGIFIGARGVARAMQNALNSAWEIPVLRRPRFPWSWLRSFALIVVIGTGLIGTTALSGLAGGAGEVLTGVGSALAALAISLGLNIGMFWLGFRLATVRDISWRQLLPGALAAALIWQVLQWAVSYLAAHQLGRASNLYGTFAIVIGLVTWLYTEALLTMCAVEANVVLAYRLWPRSLAGPPYTDQDRRAFRMYAEVQKRDEEQLVITAFLSWSAARDTAAC
jgi:membrane protein